MSGPSAPTARALDAAVRAAFPGGAGDGLAAVAPRALKTVAPYPSLLAEVGVIGSALLAIGSVPAIPAAIIYLSYRSIRAKEEDERRRARLKLAAVIAAVAALVLVPVARRPRLMQTRLWRWWIEYMSVRVAYRNGEPLPKSQYLFVMMPHGLYPFSGACATISKMVDVFSNMRIAVAPVGMKLPIIRHLMGWIGCVSAAQSSVNRALSNGDSVGLYPGGIAEMMRTDGISERLVLLQRKGFVRAALQQGISIVPVYVFGQSLAFQHLQLPVWVERIGRLLRTAIVLPYGRFGLLVPRKIPLLYAIGAPIPCQQIANPTDAQVNEVHATVVTAVKELYDFYRGVYGWGDRPLSLE